MELIDTSPATSKIPLFFSLLQFISQIMSIEFEICVNYTTADVVFFILEVQKTYLLPDLFIHSFICSFIYLNVYAPDKFIYLGLY